MSATPQGVQSLIAAGEANLAKTKGYNPNGTYMKLALADFAAASVMAGQLVAPPPPPPPSGTVLFDGRASQMASIDSYETDQAHSNLGPVVVNGVTYYYNTTQTWVDPTHPLWDCVCYGRGIGHNFVLKADPDYGNVFEVTVKVGDTNQWGGNTGGNVNGAAECSKRRTLKKGQWTWFGIGVMVPAWVGDPDNIFFCETCSLGYQTSASSQVALDLIGVNGKLNFSMFSNAGYGDNPNGWAAGATAYNTPFLPVTFGQWEEFCIGHLPSADADGKLQVYHRTKGGSWSATPIFEFDGPNEFWGVASGKTFPEDVDGQGVIDKLGMYFGLHDQTVVQQTVYETGLAVCTDLATAQGTFPA